MAVRLHDLAGHPLGYCGRRLEPEKIQRWGKWRFVGDFPKGDVLYNAHRALSHRPAGIVLTECPWSVMRLHQAGIPGAVALLGLGLTLPQHSWLIHVPKVLILFVGDTRGRCGSRTVAEILSASIPVHVHYIEDGLDPDDLSDPDLRSVVGEHLPAALAQPKARPAP